MENLVRNIVHELFETMDTNVDIMKLDLKSVTKTVLQQGIKIEEFQKKHKELEVYAKERCEN